MPAERYKHKKLDHSVLYSGFRRSVVWSFNLARETAPRLFRTMTVSFAFEAVIPVASTAAIGALANSFKDLAPQSAPSSIILLTWLVIAIGLLTAEFVLSEIRNYCRNRLIDETGLRLQKQLYQHAARMDLAFFEEGESLNRLFRATSGGSGGAVGPIYSTLSGASGLLQIISLFGLMAILQPLMAMVLLVAGIPLLAIGTLNSVEKYKVDMRTTERRRLTRYYTSRLAGEENVPSTKLLNLVAEIVGRFERISRSIIDEKVLLLKTMSTRIGCSVLLYTCVLLFVMSWLLFHFSQNGLEPGVFVAFMLAAFRSQKSIGQVSNAMASASEASLSIIPMLEFLDVEPQITDREGFVPSSLNGDVVLDGVEFTYPNAERPIIRGLSFSIPAGQKIAIVGMNGAGKSTLIKLIARLYEVDGGSILIDGHDVRELSLRWLHDHIAMVFQNPTQYEASVHENIAFGDWEKLKDMHEEVRELAHKVGLADFIEQLPEGFDTHLGRLFGEVTLSGGQWQMLSVARALARKQAILILDEPTSHLDVNAEVSMFRAIRELASDRTVIFVTHRFSTVMEADRILVIDEGRLAEDGTHEQLIKSGKFYARMVEHQTVRRKVDASEC
jgi:ATP-binding cassette, subfamily B, bacterial